MDVDIKTKYIIHKITNNRIKSKEQLYLIVHPDIEALLKANGTIVEWQDVSPGSLTLNRTICGLPYKTSNSIQSYKIMTAQELKDWENRYEYGE